MSTRAQVEIPPILTISQFALQKRYGEGIGFLTWQGKETWKLVEGRGRKKKKKPQLTNEGKAGFTNVSV